MRERTIQGRLLLASPAMSDPSFARAVVLVVRHNRAGAVGVVLNRPSVVTVDQVLPSWAALTSGPQVLFQGGPRAIEGAMGLVRMTSPSPASGWHKLRLPGLSAVGVLDLESPPVLIAPQMGAMRVFIGHVGWGGGQLEQEIADGSWYLLPAEAEDPFSAHPARLWTQVLRRQGGHLALLANLNQDPTIH
ncbi:MAG: YqgE/AlgH family protein [Candidatus Dormibacteraceae bacterium]